MAWMWIQNCSYDSQEATPLENPNTKKTWLAFRGYDDVIVTVECSGTVDRISSYFCRVLLWLFTQPTPITLFSSLSSPRSCPFFYYIYHAYIYLWLVCYVIFAVLPNMIFPNHPFMKLSLRCCFKKVINPPSFVYRLYIVDDIRDDRQWWSSPFPLETRVLFRSLSNEYNHTSFILQAVVVVIVVIVQ